MRRTIIVSAVLFCCFAGAAFAGREEDAVRQLLHNTFDKKETNLVVEPVVVADDYAIAGWTQGDMGGRALLRNRGGLWTLILCTGDAIKTADAMRQVGLSQDNADRLASALAAAEKSVTAERLAMFARFEGLVRMDEAGNHTQGHDHKR